MPKKGWKKPRTCGTSDDPAGFVSLMYKYQNWMRVNHYSETTVFSCESCLWRFFQWCSDRGMYKPGEVSRITLERYQRWLYHYKNEKGNRLQNNTQRNNMVQVMLYFRWLSRSNHLVYNPACDIELPRPDRRLPRSILSIAEVEAVINQSDITTPLGLRDRAMMELLYSSGIRRAELANLHLYDVDLEQGTVFIVEGKGRKDRLIPLGKRAQTWLEKYLTEARESLAPTPDDGTMFLSANKRSFNPGSVNHLLRKYFDKAEIKKRGACHIFRHSMATLMLENGADIRYIQHMLGHESLETTKIYTKVSIEKLKEVHRQTHPAKLHRAPEEEKKHENQD